MRAAVEYSLQLNPEEGRAATSNIHQLLDHSGMGLKPPAKVRIILLALEDQAYLILKTTLARHSAQISPSFAFIYSATCSQ